MPNMSYCMFENTLRDLQDCVHRMEEAESMEDLDINNYEKHAFYAMWRVCRDFMAEHERLLVEQGVTNE
jgi:hypothetical protein